MPTSHNQDRLLALKLRFDSIFRRLDAVKHAGSSDEKMQALLQRQLAILHRLKLLDGLDSQVSGQACQQGSDAGAESQSPASPTQQRLALELVQKGVLKHRFVRVPACYYDEDLEFRRQCLGGHSVEHLCKSIVLQNSRAPPHITDCSDPNNSKYYCVIVQYMTRMNTDKVRNFVAKLNRGKLAKQHFNFRLAPEEVSAQLTGYTHNAVTPIGLRTSIPILISHRIAELQPDFFWLGAGEVNLKVGFHARDFIAAYKPMIIDCTYDPAAGDVELDR